MRWIMLEYVGVPVIMVGLLALSFSPTRAVEQKIYTFDSKKKNHYVFDAGSLTFTNNGQIKPLAAAAAWYNPKWKYRQKLVIDKTKVAGELRDFPVFVSIDDVNNDVFGRSQNDGRDILFTRGDGTTKLAHEIEEYGPLQHSLVVWVRLPTLTNAEDTPLYMYYGNSDSTEQHNISGVWDESFAMVQHLNEKSSNGEATHKDSTSNHNDGIPLNFGGSNGSTTDARGRIGGANKFQGPAFRVAGGDRTYITVPDSPSLDISSAITLSAWGKGSGNLCCRRAIAKGNDYLIGYQLMTTTSGAIQSEFQGPDNQLGASTALTDERWYYMAATYDGAEIKLYLNGSLDASVSDTGSLTLNNYPLTIGVRADLEDYWNGELDEVRVANVARNSTWLKTEYNNQNNPATFFKSISRSVDDNNSLELLPKDALPFTKLIGFSNATAGGGKVTYQLSNDGGITWLYFHEKLGKWQETFEGATAANSADVIAKRAASFPYGAGELLWRAYLTARNDEQLILSSVTIAFENTVAASLANSFAAVPTSLSDSRIVAINTLFESVFNRPPTYEEWLNWANRVINGEKTTTAQILGAMQWQKMFGQSISGTIASSATIVPSVTGPTIEIRNGTNRQGLAGRAMTRLSALGYPVIAVGNAQNFRRESAKVYVLNHRMFALGQQLADQLAMPAGLDLPGGERVTKADILLVLGYDYSD